MKKLFYFLITVFLIINFANAELKYQQIKAFIPNVDAFNRMLNLGIDLEGSTGKVGDYFELVASEEDVQLLRENGYTVEVLIEDLSKFYSERLYEGPYDALGFGFGSMGGYYTLDEVIRQLDTMRILHPNLITEKFIIGYSLQNRPIYAVKISKDADMPSTRPEVFYNSLTHAREPAGMMAVIYFMWYLLQNYNINLEAKYLVDNRQLYFVPVVNPDGYEANRRINSNGGGMRRKNMRNVVSDNDSYGVDLNRNYGYMWGYDNSGSSPTLTAQTYRGTAPFSEPELQAVKMFCENRNFKLALNYHTYSNLLIYPWGYLRSVETPDSLIFREYAKEMTKYNRYVYGTGDQTVGYTVNGDADDWMYGEQITKNKIFSMTPEVGTSSDGFWPPSSRIFPLAQENLYPNLYLAHVAGSYPIVQQFIIQDSSGDGSLERGEKFNLNLIVRNKGLDSARNVNLTLTSGSPAIIVPSTSVSYGAIPPVSIETISVVCSVSANSPTGIYVKLFARITEETGRVILDTISVYVGKMIVAFSDSANNGISNWTTGVSWGTSTTNYSPPYSFTDSPTGSYLSNTDNSLILKNAVNLSGATKATLKFWAKWDIEVKWDFVTVEASHNGGSSWTALKGKYTKGASGSGAQVPAGTQGYDGIQSIWVEEEMDVTQYATANFKIRFRLKSDGSVTKDGFYVDDIRLSFATPDSIKYINISIQPNSINFGSVLISSQKDSVVKISNLTTSTDTLKGNVQLKYGIQFQLLNSSNFNVAVGNNYNFQLTFNPYSTGNFIDTLIINHNSTSTNSPLKVPLFGEGYYTSTAQFMAKLYIKHINRKDTLIFGAVPGATDSVDYMFGEFELPPVPPTGVFDVRWIIPGSEGSRIDLRDTIGALRPLNVYKCKYQLEMDDQPIIFRWEPNLLPEGLFHLVDAATQGSLLNVNMKIQDSVLINDPDITRIFIKHQYDPVGISSRENNFPDKFELYQNYPNPFNPVTNIKFSLPERSSVTLMLYDVLGQVVKRIYEGEYFDIGYHNAFLNAENLSSGIYFYRLDCRGLNSGKEFRSIKKLTLIK